MYESELYFKAIKNDLSSEIIEEFMATFNLISRKSLLHWSEHCTECAMPACFNSCDLYSPRFDGKCQRFVLGMQRIHFEDKTSKPKQTILKIKFKKWGVLATQAHHNLYDINKAVNKERNDLIKASIIHHLPIKTLKRKLINRNYNYKKNTIINRQSTTPPPLLPNAFLIEAYSSSEKNRNMHFVVRNDDEKYRKIPFQLKFKLTPGYNRIFIPFRDIQEKINIDISYRINIIPEQIDQNHGIYFGVLDFVSLYEPEKVIPKKIKCVVWDLDNTIWNGTLIEDGLDNLSLKPKIKEILKEIEQRGILQSVASKNNEQGGLFAMNKLGINNFFILPQISWQPKSYSIKKIAESLNIGLNTILFIDDSTFERNEVKRTIEKVRTLDAIEYLNVFDIPEMNVPVTQVSKNRKSMYLNNQKRKEAFNDFEGEYFKFLKTCEIELEILPFKKTHLQRVYELAQRTNQMNFTGNRYSIQDLNLILKNNDIDAQVLKCKDKYGDYGIIGFSIIDKEENRMLDLMFSCRIQSKRVEHAFLTHCLKKRSFNRDFMVNYLPTENNKVSSQVFRDFLFKEEKRDRNGKVTLKFLKSSKILDDQLINVFS